MFPIAIIDIISIFAPEHLAVPISVHLAPCGGQKKLVSSH